jgi:pimeloyl-ACP methyl ester carboxylesterase
MLFYAEQFERARATLEADPVATVKALMRSGRPEARGKPARLAFVRRDGGWFGGAERAPELPLDCAVLDEVALHRYASALARNGFFGPGSWYVNGEANEAYATKARHGGRLSMPVLFFHGLYDVTCETMESRLAEPMRAHCDRLAEVVVPCGHWMAQERPVEVNAGLAKWLARELPALW